MGMQMIRENDNAQAFELLAKDPLQNPYLLIDSEVYGFSGGNVDSWLLTDSSNEPYGLVYEYYNSLQLFELSPIQPEDISGICALVNDRRVSMISGRESSIRGISNALEKECAVTNGVLMRLERRIPTSDINVRQASGPDLLDAAKLICSDQEIGGHYRCESLREQLDERQRYCGCRNYAIWDEEGMVSHMATYAENDDIAILGGLVTKPIARGHGYGKAVLAALSNAILDEQKIPLLYCYQPAIIQWYCSMGWATVLECAKLEIKN